jgi:hypothetical protein
MSAGYGVEVSCTSSLRTGRLVRGWRVVAEALYRRITTKRGTLIDGDEGTIYGIDVVEWIGSVGHVAAASAFESLIRAEWQKDDRVSTISVVATLTTVDGETAIAVSGTVSLADESGSFDFTFGVTDKAATEMVSRFKEAA